MDLMADHSHYKKVLSCQSYLSPCASYHQGAKTETRTVSTVTLLAILRSSPQGNKSLNHKSLKAGTKDKYMQIGITLQ